jgi:uncharacterized membrane protein
MSAATFLAPALLALGALYVAWFGRAPDVAAPLVFGVPSLLLGALALFSRRRAHVVRFWSGVLALAWFSHGVMVAWSRPPERAYAIAEIVLALLVIYAANADAVRARFARRRE